MKPMTIARPVKMPTTKHVTCAEARELCKQPGAKVFWRPDGVVNWMLPELDVAQVAVGD